MKVGNAACNGMFPRVHPCTFSAANQGGHKLLGTRDWPFFRTHDLIGQLIYSGEHESTDQNNQAVEKLNTKKDNRPYNMGITGTDELNNKQNMLSELWEAMEQKNSS